MITGNKQKPLKLVRFQSRLAWHRPQCCDCILYFKITPPEYCAGTLYSQSPPIFRIRVLWLPIVSPKSSNIQDQSTVTAHCIPKVFQYSGSEYCDCPFYSQSPPIFRIRVLWLPIVSPKSSNIQDQSTVTAHCIPKVLQYSGSEYCDCPLYPQSPPIFRIRVMWLPIVFTKTSNIQDQSNVTTHCFPKVPQYSGSE